MLPEPNEPYMKYILGVLYNKKNTFINELKEAQMIVALSNTYDKGYCKFRTRGKTQKPIDGASYMFSWVNRLN